MQRTSLGVLIWGVLFVPIVDFFNKMSSDKSLSVLDTSYLLIFEWKW